MVILKRREFHFRLDMENLRRSVSKLVGNSYAKAGKKLNVEKEYYKGKKSLFHSLRILIFGIQIAQTGRIEDYSAANELWKEIKNVPSDDWAEFHARYKKVWNQLKTEFRKAAPLP
eukprot:TRINITY_DN2395_c0_g1_i2.p1 TRINITY_DN2395_c0_g1~~TRINITY_DN2395_c0_g1_i2.p1  ORF type:complete len:116 (+),score=29.97 TRINITY_DN2395_c0_g1_i2:429-776(+)